MTKKTKNKIITEEAQEVIALSKKIFNNIQEGIKYFDDYVKNIKNNDIEIYNKHSKFFEQVKQSWELGSESFENLDWEARNYID
jgi:pyruvate/2-oxoglutarate/acetoin dehydrogenase E1 component